MQFIEGDRTAPIITHFVGIASQGVGWEPSELVLAVEQLNGRIRLGTVDAVERVSLAERIDPRVDKISAALDAFVAAEAVPNDGGAFIQAALTGVWGSSPHDEVDSGSLTVRASRGVGAVQQ